MRGSPIAKRGCFLLLLVVLAFYFYGLGHLPFVGPDEPRYAQVAREMFLRGDMITPTLGGHTWFEKPVLLHWLVALSYRLFGISEAAARIGPAFCGLLTVAAVYWFGVVVERTAEELRGFACYSSLVLATMFGMIVFSRGVSFDVVVTMTLTWAFCFLLAANVVEAERQSRLLIGFYVFIGLSLLAKGLIGIVIPAGVIVLYQLIRRSWPDRIVRRSLIWGLPLALGVSAVWYGPVIAKHGSHFIDEFFIQHHFARFVSDKYHHPQAFYFYVPIVLALALPWLPLVIEALVNLRQLNWRGNHVADRIRVFALAWLIAPVAFFSVSKSKLPGYILPVLPALALLAGYQLTRIFHNEERRSLTLPLTGVLFLLSAIGVLIYGRMSGSLTVAATLAIAAPAFVSGIFALLAKNRHWAFLALVLAVPLSFAFALNSGASALASAESTRDLLLRADERGYKSAAVYQLHEIDRGAEFYAAGRLVYDSKGEPLKFEGAGEVLQQAKQRRETVLVIVPVRYVAQLTSLPDAETEVIADNKKLAIVAVKLKG